MLKNIEKRFPRSILLIFLFALFLRLVNLGTFPIGFHTDEARVAWNALSILKTGKDDFGNILSLYYNSFGDYRPTGIFYLTIPSLLLFGNNEFAVRVPSALFGALTVFPLYLFVLELYKVKKSSPEHKQLALFSAFLLAILPWHIEVSRATSEVVISTFFALCSFYFLIRLFKTNQLKHFLFVLATITASYLLYHSIRLLAPLFFLTIAAFYFQEIKRQVNKRYIVGALFFVFALSLFFSLGNDAKKRLNQVSIFTDQDTVYQITRLKEENKTSNLITKVFDNKYVVYSKRFLTEYPTYFSSNFLAGEEARPYRYTTPGSGLLTYVEFLLFIVGVMEVAKRNRNFLPFLLLLLAPLPGALTTEDSPNLHRSFFMIPFLVIIESYGLQTLYEIKNKYRNLILFVLSICLVINFSYFFYMYFAHSDFHKPYIKGFSLDGSSYRNATTKYIAQEIEKLKGNYDKVYVTIAPDEIYPWYAFFNNKDPKEFNTFAVQRKNGPWQYENINFTFDRCPSDYAFEDNKDKNILVVDAGFGECPSDSKILNGMKAQVKEKILHPSGDETFIFLESKRP